MKKLLTLLLTAVIGCLPMWAAAGTDTYGYDNITLKSINNGNLPNVLPELFTKATNSHMNRCGELSTLTTQQQLLKWYLRQMGA